MCDVVGSMAKFNPLSASGDITDMNFKSSPMENEGKQIDCCWLRIIAFKGGLNIAFLLDVSKSSQTIQIYAKSARKIGRIRIDVIPLWHLITDLIKKHVLRSDWCKFQIVNWSCCVLFPSLYLINLRTCIHKTKIQQIPIRGLKKSKKKKTKRNRKYFHRRLKSIEMTLNLYLNLIWVQSKREYLEFHWLFAICIVIWFGSFFRLTKAAYLIFFHISCVRIRNIIANK